MARNGGGWFSMAFSRVWRPCCCKSEVDELTDEPIDLYQAKTTAKMSQPAKEARKLANVRQTIGVHLPIHCLGKSQDADEDGAASASDNMLQAAVRVAGPVSDDMAFPTRPVIEHYDSIKVTQVKWRKCKLSKRRTRKFYCDDNSDADNEQVEEYEGGARKEFEVPQVVIHSSSDDDTQ